MLVAPGVRVFEEHQADVVKHGAAALLDVLLALPGLKQAHFEAVGRATTGGEGSPGSDSLSPSPAHSHCPIEE
jgi:hypothetical protein